MFLICRRTRSCLTRSWDGECVERPSSLLRAFIFPSRLQEVNSQRINIIRKQRKRERRRASVTKKDNTIGDGKQRLTRVRIQLANAPCAWYPGYAPPADQQGQECPGQAFADPAFVSADEVDIGALHHRYHQSRKTVAIDHELSAAVLLKADLLRRHAGDSMNLCHTSSCR